MVKTEIVNPCKKGHGKMRPGKAIRQTWVGVPDFVGEDHVCTLSPGGHGELIDCMKCPVCGYSITI